MKDSIGELSLVVIVILAISIIAGVTTFLNDTGENYIINTFNNLMNGSKKTSKGQEEASVLYTNLSPEHSTTNYNKDEMLEKELKSEVSNSTNSNDIDNNSKEKLKNTTEKNINNNNANCKDECTDVSDISDELEYNYYQIDENKYIVNVSDDTNNKDYYYTYESKDTFLFGKEYELNSVISSDNTSNESTTNNLISSEENNSFEIDEDYISKAGTQNKTNITKDKAEEIYKNNIESIVILNTYNNDIIKTSATGFFLTKGIIATSWTYIKDSLTNGNNIVALTNNNKNYNISGIITIDRNSDLALLKIEDETGKPVNLNTIEKNSEILLIGTYSGFGVSGSIGKNINNSDIQTNYLYTTYQNIGSPLFNSNGEVIGMVTGNIINKDVTNSLSSNIIKKYADYYNKINFNNINSYTLNELSKKYYKYKIVTKEYNPNILSSIWKKYKNIGNIEETIPLELVKASSTEQGISLRYINGTNVDNNLVISNFTSKLKEDKYNEELNIKKKKIYINNKYHIIIYYEFDYITVIIKDV